jgi:hypothetical protein
MTPEMDWSDLQGIPDAQFMNGPRDLKTGPEEICDFGKW